MGDISRLIHTPPWDAGYNESLYCVRWEHWGGRSLLCLGIASEGFPEEGASALGLDCTQKGRASLAKAGARIWGLVKEGGLIP